jgi:hypothetical protein
MDLNLLVFGAISIAVIHSIAPDHYFPVVMISRVKRYSLSKTLLLSGVAGGIHVTSSVLIGMAVWIGIDIAGMGEIIERISPIALIAFGGSYAVLSLFHKHHNFRGKSLLALLLIMGLSPCIPLLPLVVGSETSSELAMVSVSFSIATIGTIMLLTYLTYYTVRPPKVFHNKGDLIAGLVIMGVGIISHIFNLQREIIRRNLYDIVVLAEAD